MCVIVYHGGVGSGVALIVGMVRVYSDVDICVCSHIASVNVDECGIAHDVVVRYSVWTWLCR